MITKTSTQKYEMDRNNCWLTMKEAKASCTSWLDLAIQVLKMKTKLT